MITSTLCLGFACAPSTIHSRLEFYSSFSTKQNLQCTFSFKMLAHTKFSFFFKSLNRALIDLMNMNVFQWSINLDCQLWIPIQRFNYKASQTHLLLLHSSWLGSISGSASSSFQASVSQNSPKTIVLTLVFALVIFNAAPNIHQNKGPWLTLSFQRFLQM